MSALKRHLRAIAAYAPQLQEIRVEAQRRFLKATSRPFEPEFAILDALEIGPGECALDIGANRGQSIDAIRLFKPDVDIHAFEPNKKLAARLIGRFASDDHVRVQPMGLAEAPRAETLFVPYYGDYMFDGLASIDRAEAAEWLSARTLAGFKAEKLRLVEEDIVLDILDNQNLSPAFVKIDVQGAEAAVLAGGRETIRRCKPALLIETGVNEDLVRHVADAFGYAPFNWVGKKLQRRDRAVRNTVFVHPDRPRGLGAITEDAPAQ